VESALEFFRPKEFIKILDIGTGCGCILLSLLAEFKNAFGIGLDISAKALEVAKFNQKLLAIENASFLHIDWNRFADERFQKDVPFDMIVSNPPYIKSADIDLLDEDVKNYDPTIALDGGEDGMQAFREIATMAGKILSKNGMIFFEIGYCQEESVSNILKKNGIDQLCIKKDHAGIARVIGGSRIVHDRHNL
jgi:release factor glutamine methyltransferase